MNKLITALTLVGLMALPAFAQEPVDDVPLIFEMRGTFTSTDVVGQSFDFRPSFGFVGDVGLPLDFGVSYTNNGLPGGDGTSSMEAILLREIRTWKWGNGKSLKLELSAAVDVQDDKMVENRVYALGIIYDHGLFDYTKIGLRGVWINRDNVPNDWMVQALVQIEAIK